MDSAPDTTFTAQDGGSGAQAHTHKEGHESFVESSVESARDESAAAVASARVLLARTQSMQQREQLEKAARATSEKHLNDSNEAAVAAHHSITDLATELISQVATETERLAATRVQLQEERAVLEKDKELLLGFQQGQCRLVPANVSTTSVAEGVPGIIELNVGGVLYTTFLDTLRSAPRESVLGQMFAEDAAWPLMKDRAGRVVIDRDGKTFVHVLNYLRDGTTPPDDKDDIRASLVQEAHYFGIQGLVDWCEETWTQHLGRLRACTHSVSVADARLAVAAQGTYNHRYNGSNSFNPVWAGKLPICGHVYDPANNTEAECCYHPGELQRITHGDGGVGLRWTCCGVQSSSSSVSLWEVPGCTVGPHGTSMAPQFYKRGLAGHYCGDPQSYTKSGSHWTHPPLKGGRPGEKDMKAPVRCGRCGCAEKGDRPVQPPLEIMDFAFRVYDAEHCRECMVRRGTDSCCSIECSMRTMD